MPASDGITTRSATMIPQPPSHPTFGPNVRVAQVNVVPQSGSTLLNERYADAMKYIGTNANSMTATAWTPVESAT